MLIKELTKLKYKGIKQARTANEITKLIYRAKFLQEEEAIINIAEILYETIHDVDFNIIVPI